jgi:hypothetical protein
MKWKEKMSPRVVKENEMERKGCGGKSTHQIVGGICARI